LDIYYKSVGRNGVLLLNLPPDRRGLIYETDVENLATFKSDLDAIFAVNLAEGASLLRQSSGEQNVEVTAELGERVTFDHIVLGEDIEKGQRISQFHVEAETGEGEWITIAQATTIGYKRILQVERVTTSKVKVVIEASKNPPLLSEVGLYSSGN